jgi:hypothetical protein
VTVVRRLTPQQKEQRQGRNERHRDRHAPHVGRRIQPIGSPSRVQRSRPGSLLDRVADPEMTGNSGIDVHPAAADGH